MPPCVSFHRSTFPRRRFGWVYTRCLRLFGRPLSGWRSAGDIEQPVGIGCRRTQCVGVIDGDLVKTGLRKKSAHLLLPIGVLPMHLLENPLRAIGCSPGEMHIHSAEPFFREVGTSPIIKKRFIAPEIVLVEKAIR